MLSETHNGFFLLTLDSSEHGSIWIYEFLYKIHIWRSQFFSPKVCVKSQDKII